MLHIDQIENADFNRLIKSALTNLQSFSDCKQLYWIEKLDKVTASVNHSLPGPSPVNILDPTFFDGVSEDQPVYFQANPFTELQDLAGTASTMVILPLINDKAKSCVVLFWERSVEFSQPFKEFIYIAFSVLRRIARVSAVFTSVERLEVHFNAILQTVPQSVIFIDDSGKQNWVNENASRLFNLPAGIVEPAVLAAAMQSFRNRADNRDEIFQRGMEFFESEQKEVREWKWIYSHPELLVLNVYCTPTNSANVNGVLWMFENITEEYLADKQIQELNLKLQQASAYKSEFLANMSHELRTPLNSILVLANLLAENEPGNLTAGQIKDAGIILNSGNDLLFLINDILDLSKIEAGKMDLIFDAESIEGIAENMSDLFSGVAKTKNIEFKLEIKSGIPQTVYTDRQRLCQVIKNLLSNAFKFTPAGGSVTLRFDTGQNGQMLKISVQDTGIGVEASKKKEIFEAFKQADGTTSRNYGGTGLGLSISKHLVWKFGGEISIVSTLGKGSIFTVEIPLKMESEESIVPEIHINEPEHAEVVIKLEFPELKDKKILLLSDDVRQVFSLNAELDHYGLKIRYGFSSKEFLPLIESDGPPDLVVIDLSMENFTAYEKVKSLCVSSPLNSIPVLAIAPKGFLENIDLAVISVQALLYKPVSTQQLLPRIGQLLMLNQ